MRSLYDRLLAEGEAGIEALIAEQTQENVQLDFKGKRNPGSGGLEADDRKVFGKAISAFANSAGGLLVWGVDARKVNNIDCAQPPGLPIAEIDRFKSEVIRAAGDSLMPRYEGISVELIRTQDDPTRGYLLVYVERSDRRPHRCEVSGEKQYFKRAGDSSFAMEHYDIEDAFSRSGIPMLELYIVPGVCDYRGQDAYFPLKVVLKNISNTIAKFPYVAFNNMHGLGVDQRHGSSKPFRAQSEGGEGSLAGGASDVVHPGTSSYAGSLLVVFGRDEHKNWKMMDEIDSNDGPRFNYMFGCEGMAGVVGQRSYSRSELALPR